MTIRIAAGFLAFFAAGLVVAPAETSARNGGREFRAAGARPAVAQTANQRLRQRRLSRDEWWGAAPWYGGYYDDPNQSSYVPPVQQQPTAPAIVHPNSPSRSGCTTQSYKVPSESGKGERTVKVVNCY